MASPGTPSETPDTHDLASTGSTMAADGTQAYNPYGQFRIQLRRSTDELNTVPGNASTDSGYVPLWPDITYALQHQTAGTTVNAAHREDARQAEELQLPGGRPQVENHGAQAGAQQSVQNMSHNLAYQGNPAAGNGAPYPYAHADRVAESFPGLDPRFLAGPSSMPNSMRTPIRNNVSGCGIQDLNSSVHQLPQDADVDVRSLREVIQHLLQVIEMLLNGNRAALRQSN